MKLTYLLFSATRTGGSKLLFVLLTISILICSNKDVMGQITVGELTGAELNAIQTSVPFLTIAPDGRSSGMGDVGAASVPDANSQHWNSAKYAFVEGNGGISLTYTPWLRNLIPGINLGYISGYYRINSKNTVSSSIRYFSLGKMTDMNSGVWYPPYYQYEIAIDAGYSRLFTDHFSGGIVLRYIHSDLIDNMPLPGFDIHPGRSVAGDLGLYYQNDFQIGEKDALWAVGINITNLGPPISYRSDEEKTPIPTNLRFGGRFSYNINENNIVSFHADINKLLVPSPALYAQDSATNDLIVIRGKEAPGSVILGMFQSFYDAPGVQRSDGTYNVLEEEIYEIMFGLGAEYWHKKQFAIRTGYFNEHATKGNRKYFTFGIGARYRFLTCDISYLLPQKGQNSPLYNTFRFSLTAEFGKI
jgi:hypothetical protein